MNGLYITTLFYYFIIYSFLGWLMESSIFTFKEHRFISRGFLNGPVCPVYGTGMVLIIVMITPLKSNPIFLFIMGGLLATVVEYFTGYILEKLFNTKWWDYSKDKWNINGYVCALNSFYWCILSVVMIYFIQPFIDRGLSLINHQAFYLIGTIIFVIIILDTFMSVSTLIGLRSKLKHLSQIKSQLNDFVKQDDLLNLKVISDSFEKLIIDAKSKLDEMINVEEKKDLITRQLKKYEVEYQKVIQKENKHERRLFKNYPHAKSRRFKNAFNAIRAMHKK